jgi:hypothetical protein
MKTFVKSMFAIMVIKVFIVYLLSIPLAHRSTTK